MWSCHSIEVCVLELQHKLGPELALDKDHMVFLQVTMLSRRPPSWDDAERALGAVPQPRRMLSLISSKNPVVCTVFRFDSNTDFSTLFTIYSYRLSSIIVCPFSKN